MTVEKVDTPNEVLSPRTVVSLAPGRAASGDTGTQVRPQTRRRRWLTLSFVFCVLLPITLGTLYYTLVASDRYVSGAGFAVRGLDGGGGIDVVGAFTGMASSGSTTSESYIVLKYLNSRDLLENIQTAFPFQEKYSASDVDFLSRLDPNLPIEDQVDYWNGVIATTFDSTSGIITFDVDAFQAKDAERMANLVLENTRALVNQLSESARRDSVRFAEAEVHRAEARLREVLQQVRTFRDQELSINPAASAQLQIELLASLKMQLVDLRSRIAALGRVDESSPAKINLQRKADALKAQIAEQTLGIAAPPGKENPDSPLTGLLATYEALEIEKTFAEQAYASALSSLEQARIDADRQQRYLAVYSYPSLPEDAIYPRRALNIFILSVVAISMWGIGVLVTYSVRDHIS
ncbi:hypothetical protein [Ruegeria profundi]|uniref:Sugar transporter n=1 Tax=Ruegeria profundi TaxID=1685378 RepID=A0A0X3TS27_9RHOB|nr:hypothetical protein [Ruegeria profundi]KUJ77276.1 hypothetical protein AVO44_18015 [Ruegeria profundi]